MDNTVIKYLKKVLDFDKSEVKEIRLEAIKNDDFEVNNYRFISDDIIDDVMIEELSSDTYMLGCFNADFLSSICDLPYDVIVALQEAESFEAIGEVAIANIKQIAEEYARLDGYGHHFSSYDGHGHEVENWHIFRVN